MVGAVTGRMKGFPFSPAFHDSIEVALLCSAMAAEQEHDFQSWSLPVLEHLGAEIVLWLCSSPHGVFGDKW